MEMLELQQHHAAISSCSTAGLEDSAEKDLMVGFTSDPPGAFCSRFSLLNYIGQTINSKKWILNEFD
jgi:hypothetical protein